MGLAAAPFPAGLSAYQLVHVCQFDRLVTGVGQTAEVTASGTVAIVWRRKMFFSLLAWCWMILGIYLQESLKELVRTLKRLWRHPGMRRALWFLKAAFWTIRVASTLWKAARLISEWISWIKSLDDWAIQLIVWLVFS
jgi:hypothetical protein